MANGWTEERRTRQAELIRAWQPWNHSTGPRTPSGKAASSQNRAQSLRAAAEAIAKAERELLEARRNLARLRGR
jgi:hypothetical protein